MSYLILLIICLVSLIITAKIDKYFCIKKNLINEEISSFDTFPEFFAYYHFRLKAYKFLLILSFVPLANFVVGFILIMSSIALIIMWILDKISNNKLLNKLF